MMILHLRQPFCLKSFKMTMKAIILAENLLDHNRVHDLLLRRYKALTDNNFPINACFQDRFYGYVITDKLKLGG